MKEPRVDAFNTSKSVKPLKSSMDDMPAIEPQLNKSTPVNSSTTVPPVRGVLPQVAKRKIKSRHPFDIYEDQAEALKQLSIEDRMRGGVGSMSAMVREALDDYIKKVKQ